MMSKYKMMKLQNVCWTKLMGFNLWKDCERKPLPDILNFIVDNRGKTVPTDSEGNHILIATNCVRNENLYPSYEKIRFLNEDTYQNWFRAHPIPGDILFVCKGTPGRCCMVPNPIDFCIAQDMVALRCNESIVYNKYLLAILRSAEIQAQITNTSVGDVIPHFKKSFFNQLLIPIPSLEIQKAIGDVYFLFSEKQELNKKINENLSKQIHTLCNAWLNDYSPFGGICPDDWELTPLSSIARFISGYSYKGNELQASSVAMATIKNFDRHGGFKLDGYKEILPSSKLKPEHHVTMFDTLVAHTDLTQNAEVIGNAEPVLSFSGYDDIIFSMDVVKVLSTNPEISKFMIAAILQTQQFKGHCLGYVNGTTVLHLSKKALPGYSLMLPNDFSVLKPLDSAVSSMYQQMALNIDENVQLTKLRDNLLPRLISGDLDVSNLDC